MSLALQNCRVVFLKFLRWFFFTYLWLRGENSRKSRFFETVLLGIQLKFMDDKYKDMMDEGFLMEARELHMAMDELIEKYDLRSRVMNCMVTGLLHPIDEETSEMKAIFTYSIETKDELEEVISFIVTTFEEQKGPDLDELLGGLGISLN